MAAFLIAHVVRNRKGEIRNAAQAMIFARTRDLAQAKFRRRYPQREIRAVGRQGEAG